MKNENEEISYTETKRLVKLMSSILGCLFIGLFILCVVGFVELLILAINDNSVGMLVGSILLLFSSLIILKILSKLEIKKEKSRGKENE